MRIVTQRAFYDVESDLYKSDFTLFCYEILGVIKMAGTQPSYHLVYIDKYSEVGCYKDNPIYKPERLQSMLLRGEPGKSTKSALVRVMLFVANSNFYFATREVFASKYVWNKELISVFANFSSSRLETQLFCGYFRVSEIKASGTTVCFLSVISSTKIGPRFYCRGVDDHGNVSFFVKTEIIVFQNGNFLYDFVIYRGSIPLFWYQDKNPLRKKLKFSREVGVSKAAFIKHFAELKGEVRQEVCVVNLLGQDNYEADLGALYNQLLGESEIVAVSFDLNRFVSDFDALKERLCHKLPRPSHFVFRVNCLDCLDRTNIAQYLICEFTFKYLFDCLCDGFYEKLKKLWVRNGDSLSYFYSGSQSLKSDLATKGKISVSSRIDDLFRNATRFVTGKFMDCEKRRIIDTILGTDAQYSLPPGAEPFTDESIAFKVYSWNVLGKKCAVCPPVDFFTGSFDIVVINLQKIGISKQAQLFDKEQKERAYWKEYFAGESSIEYVLVTQNFTDCIGILVFARPAISQLLVNIRTEKMKTKLISSDVMCTIEFTFMDNCYIFANVCVKNFVNGNIPKILSMIEDVNPAKPDCLRVIAGSFLTNFCLNDCDIIYYMNNGDYEALSVFDLMFNSVKSQETFTEPKVLFAPFLDSNKITLSNRILFAGNLTEQAYGRVTDRKHSEINIVFFELESDIKPGK